MKTRIYQADSDWQSASRVWQECGWLSDEKEELARTKLFFEKGQPRVALLSDEIESVVFTHPATIRYGEQQLAHCAVTAVTTSMLARKQGLAAGLLAESLQKEAENGAVTAGLGIFEQGYYDRLGFGNFSGEYIFSFDPANLVVPKLARPPVRLTKNDYKSVFDNLASRVKQHGSITITDPAWLEIEFHPDVKQRLFGFRDDAGCLTHHICLNAEGGEHDPHDVLWYAFQTPRQFVELLSFLASLAEQVKLFKMRQPPGFQLQDYLKNPIRGLRRREGELAPRQRYIVYHQVRLLDLAAAVAVCNSDAVSAAFNLDISDPIEKYLNSDYRWQGCAGRFNLHLGKNSTISRGFAPGLPLLETTVNQFCRLWSGSLGAFALSARPDFNLPDCLVEQLDNFFRLPAPKPDWDY